MNNKKNILRKTSIISNNIKHFVTDTTNIMLKYDYATYGSVSKELIKELKEQKLHIRFEQNAEKEIQQFLISDKNYTKMFINLNLKMIVDDLENDEQIVTTSTSFAELKTYGEKSDSDATLHQKKIQSNFTYMKRYMLFGYFGITEGSADKEELKELKNTDIVKKDTTEINENYEQIEWEKQPVTDIYTINNSMKFRNATPWKNPEVKEVSSEELLNKEELNKLFNNN